MQRQLEDWDEVAMTADPGRGKHSGRMVNDDITQRTAIIDQLVPLLKEYSKSSRTLQ